MAKTGPQKYPGANTSAWYQGRYPGDSMESNVGVIHTTEGTTLPTYGGGASAPNFTAVPDIPNKRLKWYQHFDFDVSSRALVNKAGGVETNTLNAVQVELVGTCDPARRTSWNGLRAGTGYLFWPDAPDWALRELAKFVAWAYAAHGVKLRSAVTFKAYPGSYGATATRLTPAAWTQYYGWCGHQHVPENDHGDPGDLDVPRVLEYARSIVSPPTTPAPAPSTGARMLYTSVARTAADLTVASGASAQIYFDTEYVDEPGDHGTGGKTVLAGPNTYSGTLSLGFDAPLLAGVSVRMVRQKSGSPDSGEPETDLAAGPVKHSVPVTGHVASGWSLVAEVTNESGYPVTLEWAGLRLHSQASTF